VLNIDLIMAVGISVENTQFYENVDHWSGKNKREAEKKSDHNLMVAKYKCVNISQTFGLFSTRLVAWSLSLIVTILAHLGTRLLNPLIHSCLSWSSPALRVRFSCVFGLRSVHTNHTQLNHRHQLHRPTDSTQLYSNTGVQHSAFLCKY